MSKNRKNAPQSATATETPVQEPVAQTTPEPTTTPAQPSASEQIRALRAQLAALQSAAKAEVSEVQAARLAAQAELKDAQEAWDTLGDRFPEVKAAAIRVNEAKAKVKELGGKGHSSNGQPRELSARSHDPAEGKGVFAAAIRVMRAGKVNQPCTVKEVYDAVIASGEWTPTGKGKTPMDSLAAQMAVEVNRPGACLTRPSKGHFQLA